MSYSKQTWATGDTITAAKLNHMEDGIAAAGVMMVHAENNTLDKTWREINTAVRSGVICLYVEADEIEIIVTICAGTSEDDGVFNVYFASGMVYTTNSADGYPHD